MDVKVLFQNRCRIVPEAVKIGASGRRIVLDTVEHSWDVLSHMQPTPDLALLLGAVFGDGYIQKVPKCSTYKIAVTSGDKYPTWLAEIPRLFQVAFGRLPNKHRKKRVKKPFFEFFLNVKNLWDVFGIDAKYSKEHHLVVPAWIEADPELVRQFLRGLVETDGCFHIRKDKRYPLKGWVSFVFTQKDEVLTNWVLAVLREHGFPARKGYGKKAQAWAVRVDVQREVVHLGEWLESFKWQQLLASGFEPRVGRISATRRVAKVLSTIPKVDQDEWRSLRKRGASVVAIARHYSRSNNVIQDVVCDIVPVRAASCEELGLVVRPRFPRESNISATEVSEWRAAVSNGESAKQVALRFKRPSWTVVEATCDLIRRAS